MSQVRCVLHGSFRKYFPEIQAIHKLFTAAGIEVLAPTMSEIKSLENGFAILESDIAEDPRMIELLYLHHLKRLGSDGFSYFVNPDGYIGKSASYELGIAHATNVRCFFTRPLDDHPAYFHDNAVMQAEELVEYLREHGKLPEPRVRRNEEKIHSLWEELIVPGSVVAVGAMIEYVPVNPAHTKEVLLVKTHKWGGRYSMVGGKVRRHERLDDALKREIMEETGLTGGIGEHICTFDQIKNSGYYLSGVQHIYVDKTFQVDKRQVKLNEEAQEYLWAPAHVALRDLDIEPNARHTLQLYSQLTRTSL